MKEQFGELKYTYTPTRQVFEKKKIQCDRFAGFKALADTIVRIIKEDPIELRWNYMAASRGLHEVMPKSYEKVRGILSEEMNRHPVFQMPQAQGASDHLVLWAILAYMRARKCPTSFVCNDERTTIVLLDQQLVDRLDDGLFSIAIDTGSRWNFKTEKTDIEKITDVVLDVTEEEVTLIFRYKKK